MASPQKHGGEKKGDMAVGKKSETPISNKSICKISRCNSNSG